MTTKEKPRFADLIQLPGDKGPDTAKAYKMIGQICKRFEITEEEIYGRKKTADIALPRAIAMFLVRERTNLTLSDIGDIFKKPGRGTAWKAWRKVVDYEGNPVLKKIIKSLIQGEKADSEKRGGSYG